MFFDAQLLAELSSQLEADPLPPGTLLSTQAIARLSYGAVPENIYPDLATSFILNHPSSEEQRKILQRFHQVATKHRATIRGFRWWDIVPKELWLFAEVIRDETLILVSLSWRQVKKGAPDVLNGQVDASWVRDNDGPNRLRFHFSQPEYHSLVAAFTSWIAAPLPEIPVQLRP